MENKNIIGIIEKAKKRGPLAKECFIAPALNIQEEKNIWFTDEEAKILDTSRSLMNPRSSNETKVRPVTAMTKSASSYNNYPQRQYSQEELDDLESKLLALAVAQN